MKTNSTLRWLINPPVLLSWLLLVGMLAFELWMGWRCFREMSCDAPNSSTAAQTWPAGAPNPEVFLVVR